jgi:chorismate dehydratase
MVLFGKIDYINLLPFYTFAKRHIRSSQLKQSIAYKKDFPSAINQKFKKRKIDAAFISSIESKRGNFTCLDVGIVAKKEILSVLVKEGDFEPDSHSATSNALAQKLGIKGEVIIGDKALRLYLENPDAYIDLATAWHKQHKLPFVFALLCVHKNRCYYKRLSQKFVKTRVKIPYYILQKYAKSRSIMIKDIKRYLDLVSYEVDTKAKKGLKRFLV